MSHPEDTEPYDFVQRLPKTETHLHIEGALPFHLLQDLHPERYREPPASWAPDFKFVSFKQFEDELLDMALKWYKSPERYHEAAKGNIRVTCGAECKVSRNELPRWCY